MNILRVIIKFRSILSKHQKSRIIELFILMLAGGILEMVSVSLMLPFINAVMDSQSVMSNKYIVLICNILGIQSDRIFLVLSALVLSFGYILKNIFLVFQLSVQNRFVYRNMFSIQNKLLRNYLSRSYDFFLGVNSGEVIRVIGSDTADAFGLLTSLLSLFTELAVSVMLVAAIFVMAPGITLGMAVMLLIMVGVILSIIRPLLRKSGLSIQMSGAQMNQWLIQSIQGIKEIKITGKEDFFEQNYNKYGAINIRSRQQSATLTLIPRFLIEAVSMSSFFTMSAILIYRGSSLDDLVPVLSAVAMAAVRLLPSVNRIAQAVADVAYREPMLDKMIENLNEAFNYNGVAKSVSLAETELLDFTDALKLSSVTFRYPKGERNILTKASIEIKKGTSVGIVGISGAGKTTVADILIGLLFPQDGSVTVDNHNIHDNLENWISKIGYIPQSIFVLNGNIRENVAFGVPEDKINDEQVWKALQESFLEEFVRNLPEGLYTKLGERGLRLSGGQRQRIGIARALYHNPSVLIFDEATSALDNETEKAIMDSINELHGTKTLIIIAHRLTTIAQCDVVFRVENEKIIQER